MMRYTDKEFSMPENEFKANYRVSKDLYEENYQNIIRPLYQLQRGEVIYSPNFSGIVFYATGSYQRVVGGTYGTLMSQQSVSRAIRDVTAALNHQVVLSKWIKFPQTRQERDSIKRRFYEIYHIPSVLGCIYGTHVAIIRPTENDERYFNRKLFHSRNVMIICDADLKILSVDALFGGASHDSFVWNQHPIKQHLINLNNNGENNRWRCLLGHRVLHYHPDGYIRHNMCINRIGFDENIANDGYENPDANSQESINSTSAAELRQGIAKRTVLVQ
ncbi:hypothetical protein HF086_001132 [Spodoptera exigua]|uniref:DDE Tnp4 domain-containing protein n=1 Tax=Spodoptera exigua TaxID=7107 RepID=A0A922M4M4_SPOEX|nr:hypothetical protein HF086_001132 [Spodoptera exigua]